MTILDQTTYAKAPNNLGESFERYIEHGIPTGGFLRAVLENDLREAFGRADIYNRSCMFEIVAWLWNEAPSTCWGSPEKVSAWLAMKAKERVPSTIR